MEVSISSKKEKALLGRIEIQGEVSFKGATPSRSEVRKKLAEQLGSSEELIVLRRMETDFGRRKAEISANLYSDKAVLEKTEPKIYQNRMLSKEAREKLKQARKEGSAEKPAEGQ